MYGYIYKTINLINGKIYIGKHKASEFNPNYKGSGTSYLQNAFKKYGKENFKVEFLIPCFSLEELNAEEQFLIEWFNARDRSIGYNRAKGGDGGDLYDKSGCHNPMYGVRLTGERNPNYNKCWIHNSITSKLISKSEVPNFLREGWILGMHPESNKKKARDCTGSNNSNYGKIRINNGELTRIVSPSDLDYYIEQGFKLGGLSRIYHLVCNKCGSKFESNSPSKKFCSNCN